MIILSIDSGVEKTGYSLFEIDSALREGFKYLTSGLIRTNPSLKIEKRIEKICKEINRIIKKYKPEKFILEQLFFFKNQKTVISVSQSQGAVMYLAAKNDMEVIFLPPLQIKQIVTGYGNADKQSIQKMIKLILPNKVKMIEDDQSDAIACGLAYCYLHKNNIK